MLIFFLLTGLSFKTESRIEFLTPGTGGTKVLGNIPDTYMYIYFKIKKRFIYLLPASRGSNVMILIFTPG